MKRNILFGSVLAAALSVGLGAQAPTGAPQDPAAPPSSPRPSPSAQAPSAEGRQQQQERDGDRLSAGRLGVGDGHERRRGAGRPAGGAAAGGAASSSKSESFILANASRDPARSGAAGAAGTAGSASSSSASQYKLIGRKQV